MPINVSGKNNSNENCYKIDTSLFVQKPYLRTKCIDANIKEDVSIRNQFRIRNYLIFLALEKQLQKTMLITNLTIHL